MRLRHIASLIMFVFLVITHQAFSYSEIDSTVGRPIIEAIRVGGSIHLDGILDEAEWQRAGISSFTQKDPVEGAAASEKTEVWVAYDDAALYVAARMYDSSPDSIVSRIGRRDADLNADWFYVGIDSYHDRRTGFFFGVYAGGAIADGTLYNDSWDDDSWDGVWDSGTQIDDRGWTVEMKIPYSQLRFPKLDEYVWGINFGRQIERKKEEAFFVMVPKKESGWTSRFADLTGIRNINPPPRIELLPYVVSGAHATNQFDAGDPFNDGSKLTGNIGADFKLGLGSNLTLSATINPDFGQVEVDPAVVNLSQFETFYDEKRPFFIEGSNFFNFGYGGANNNWGFNWGSPDYFYSRRIGRSPQGSEQHEGFTDRPDGTTILGAAKLTGKLNDRWSVGTLHAFTEREYATVQDTNGVRYRDVVGPFESDNIVRVLGEFNQGRQALGVIATAAVRDLNQPYLADQFNKNAFAIGVDGWTNLDSAQTYVVTGWFSASRVNGSKDRILQLQKSPLHYYQRPDASEVEIDPTATSLSGYASRFALNKQKGNFRLNSAIGIISPGFDSNDLGFLFRTNVVNAHLVLGYRWFDPDGLFRSKGFDVATFRNFSFAGDKTGEGYFLFYNAQLMNYWGFNGSVNFNRGVLDNRATRGGAMMKSTNSYGFNTYVYSDSRSSVVFGVPVSMGRSESGGWYYYYGADVEWKPGSGVKLTVGPGYSRDVTIAQFVANVEDPTATHTYGTRHIFGRIEQREFSSNVRLDWTFSPKLSLQLFMQPLISVGTFDQFKELKEPRTYTFNRYGEDNGSTLEEGGSVYSVDPDGAGPAASLEFDNPNFNFKSLRGNAVLRWEYLPGSTMFFVWTRGQTNFGNPGDFQFGRDFANLVRATDHNTAFLIKIAYWWHP